MELIRMLPAVVAKRGPRFLAKYFTELIWFDIRHGTRTSMRVENQAASVGQGPLEDGVHYVASFTSVVQRSVDLAFDIVRQHDLAPPQFIDLGCGKGKALITYCLECRPPLSPPALGLEYDSRLAEAATRNLRRCGLDSSSAAVVVDTATNVRRHVRGESAIVYLYNPFRASTFRAVLGGLSEIPHVLIYVDPVEEDALLEFGYDIRFRNAGRYNADTWLVATRGVSAKKLT